MENFTDEQILEMYEKLPEDLKKAIFSVEMTGAVKTIGEKYQLAIDKIGALGNETGMVMLGVTHPRDFIPNLASRLNVDKETSRKIADEISTQIFSKVRESLKKIQGETSDVGEKTSDVGEAKEEILKEIEKPEVPEILRGIHESSFDLKTKEDIFRMPPEESIHEEGPKKQADNKYPHSDPYREPVE